MKTRLAIVISILSAINGITQTRTIDSLKHVANTSKNIEERLQAVYSLNDHTVHADTLLRYVQIAESVAPKSNDKNGWAKAAYCRAGYYARKNYIDSAIAVTNNLVEQFKNKRGEEEFYLNFLFFRAKLFDRANQYSKSLAQLYDVVEKAEVLHDTLILIQARTGIGWVLIEMEQYKEALKWLYAAKHTSSNKKYYKNYGALYSNLATAFNGLGKKDSAIYYINYAIKDARQNENLLFLATALSMEAKIYVDNGLLHLAEQPLQEVLEIRKKLNDPFYVVFDMSNLASYYAKSNQPQKGIAICKKGIAIAKQLGLPSQLLMVYRAMAENYKAAGNTKEYSKTLEHILALKDSFNNINSVKMLSEFQASNETRKKEKTITEQRLNLTIKNYVLYGSGLFAVLIGIIGWLSFKNYRRRQNAALQLAIEKEKFLSTQAVKDAEEHERRRIASDLHDSLGAQANAILYSVELLQQKQEEEVLVADLHYTARDMLTSLRETLWALKNTEAAASDIWLRIINFSRQLGRHYQTIRITTEGASPTNLIFSSTKALNIVFIIQEAVNNAVRHSGANNIVVTSSYNGLIWTISVKDEGEGFDPRQVQHNKESYGLHNIEERAAASGYQLIIKTQIGEGTRVMLRVPIEE